jgi:hypothetical protein
MAFALVQLPAPQNAGHWPRVHGALLLSALLLCSGIVRSQPTGSPPVPAKAEEVSASKSPKQSEKAGASATEAKPRAATKKQSTPAQPSQPGQAAKGTAGGAATANRGSACLANFMKAQELRTGGQWLQARKSLRRCGQRSCSDVVRVKCVEWLGELQGQLPSIVIAAKDKGGNDLSSVSLTIDGNLVPFKKARLGIELDPGEHALELRHKGRRRGVRIVLAAGEKNRAVRVTFARRLQPKELKAAERAKTAGWTPLQIATVASFSSAAVAVAIGSVTGVLALERATDVAAACEFRTCNPPDFPVYDGGLGLAHASTVSFSLGAAALVGGLTVWLVDRASNKKEKKKRSDLGFVWRGRHGAMARWDF